MAKLLQIFVPALSRRRFLHLATGAALLPAIPSIASAQAFPSRPVTIIVPFPAGGPADVIARIVGDRMRTSLGQPVIVENVSGAGGTIGVARAARAAPDGYTLSMGQLNSHVCLPQIKLEHIGDAVHPGSAGTECIPLPRRHVISGRPCSAISECACHYSSPCRTAAHGADGVRRTPRYGRGIPCGSSRSTVLRMRFARVNAERSGGLECRSIERGGQISLRMHRRDPGLGSEGFAPSRKPP